MQIQRQMPNRLRQAKYTVLLLVLFGLTFILAATTTTIAGASAIEPPPYNPFPEPGNYVTGPVALYPWAGETFESYNPGQLVECSSQKNTRSHLDVTSGCLYAQQFEQARRGWTNKYNFRMLAVGTTSNAAKVKWTDQRAEYTAYLQSWLTAADGSRPDWSGLHIFARYQNEYNLYVAGFRYDGEVTIKKKIGYEQYITMAKMQYLPIGNHPELARWYKLRFEAVGNKLDFYINEQHILSATDNDVTKYGEPFTWGTTGIRTDYVQLYLDNWFVH